ncbi:hypothetical protein Cal7507_0824 [Calothrix sp. PCC 7507]|nr:hypothetical protein Cal7507_0824 [Calothrix sp. PCC 7507]
MTQALTKPITVKEFLEWIPENSGKRYELHSSREFYSPGLKLTRRGTAHWCQLKRNRRL